nr:hypothetical protein [Tanacetum cinerariifolium]
LNGVGLCWEVMKGRGGLVKRWWSGAEMGRSGDVESGGNSGLTLLVLEELEVWEKCTNSP